jgi:hypothetical protein
MSMKNMGNFIASIIAGNLVNSVYSEIMTVRMMH